MGAQWVRHRWFAEGLLEGGLLQLQDEPIGLLTLRLPLLGRLSPKKGQSTWQVLKEAYRIIKYQIKVQKSQEKEKKLNENRDTGWKMRKWYVI